MDVSLTALMFAVPAAVFVFFALVSWAGWGRRFGWLPVLAVHGVVLLLLFKGGLHRVAHVRLEGMEVDLVDRRGRERMVTIGGDGETAAVRVPGLAEDALRVKLEQEQLYLIPGSGGCEGVLVRSGGEWLSTVAPGLPRMEPLEDGDVIEVPAAAGGAGILSWTLGSGASALTPPVDEVRWVGGDGAGVSAAPGYPARVFGVQVVGKGMSLSKGEGHGPGVVLRVDGWPVEFGERAKRLVRYDPGRTTIELAREDVLAGGVGFSRGGFFGSRVEITQGERRRRLPNRRVEVPLVGLELPVATRLRWTQAVYPLAELAAGGSGLRSVIVEGAPGQGRLESGLLVMDHGVRVAGRAEPVSDRRLRSGTEFEVRQLIEGEAGPRVRLRRRLRELGLEWREREGRKVPVLTLVPVTIPVRSVPIGELRKDVAADDDADGRVAFGLNDLEEFSALPHQVKFGGLPGRFRAANGEVELGWFGIRVRDDYAVRELDYGESFTVGGGDRIRVRVDKMVTPWQTIGMYAAIALVALVVAGPWLGTIHGASLFFAVSFIAGARVLFAHAARVNAPYDEGLLGPALLAALVVPVGLALIAWLGTRRIRSWLEWLDGWLGRIQFRWLVMAGGALLLLRVILLFAGMKEGMLLGGGRVALSVLFVPGFLVLFGLAAARQHVRGGSLWPWIATSAWLMGCQLATGFLVSDVGTFVFLIPQAMVLAWAGVGVLRGWKGGWKPVLARVGTAAVLLAPLVGMGLVFFAPRVVVDRFPGLREKLENPHIVATGNTLLRVLNFVDKDYLINLGTDAAEGIAQDHAIMENYAHRGMTGEGYLGVDVIRAKHTTALNDNVGAVYVFGQFGVIGGCALAAAYLAAALAGCRPWHSPLRWVGGLAALTFSLTSLYMLAANWGLLPYTGRNLYLLGLNSLSDIAEGFVLLALVVLGLAAGRRGDAAPVREGAMENHGMTEDAA